MAGIKLVVDLEPETALQLAWRAAQDLSFTLTPVQDGAFEAKKGHLVWSMLAGPAATHCHFKIAAHRYVDRTTDLVLERNSAWTSGLLGRRHINAEADALMQRVAEAIGQNGGKVIELQGDLDHREAAAQSRSEIRPGSVCVGRTLSTARLCRARAG